MHEEFVQFSCFASCERQEKPYLAHAILPSDLFLSRFSLNLCTYCLGIHRFAMKFVPTLLYICEESYIP